MQRIVASFLAVLLLVIAVAHDTLALTPVQELAAPYHFNYVIWESANFPAKWFHLLVDWLQPFKRTDQEKLARLQEYFRQKGELSGVEYDLSQAAAVPTGRDSQASLERRQADLRRRIAALRPATEETLESLISTALRQEGVPLRLGGVIFPPTDIAMADLPTILIVSPRDRIERQASYLLVPNIPPSSRTALEDAVLQRQNLAALVDDIGGISTYPAIIQSTDLRYAFIVASHEWLHNYLFFQPLGQNIQKDGDMSSLNETTANLFGNELGNRIYSRLMGEPEPPLPQPSSPSEPCPQDQFCFGREMHETRLHTDELLAQGSIEEAEAYMEERRQAFLDNGYNLRRINQAYFAFHGTYADTPSSVSPIYQQLLDVRSASPNLAAFIHTMQVITSYQQFLELHQGLMSNP